MKKLFVVLAAVLLLVIMACSKGGDTTIQTTAAVVPATTKILDSSSSSNLSSVSPDGVQLTFSGTTPQISSFNVGDVVVSDASSSAPDGILRKITSIDTSGGQVVVNTTGATIEEAIQKGSWSITQSLDSNQSLKAVHVAQGVKIKASVSLGTFDVSINNVSLSDNIFANGSISIKPSYTFSGEVDNFKLKKLTFTSTTNETCTITLSSNASLVDYNKSIEIAKYNMPTLTILVGSFPIVITPVLTVNVGLSGNVSVGISTGIGQEATYTNGLSYDSGSGWSTIKDQTKSFTFTPPTVTAAATAKCYAGPKLELLLYGSAGPYASADGYLELDANPLNNPWWQLYGGIEASAGVELTILSHLVASYSANVFDERVLITQADGGYVPPVPSNYTVSGTVTYNGAGLAGVTVTLTGTGSSSTVTDATGGYTFTNAANGSYTLSFSSSDYTFSPSSLSIEVSGANFTVSTDIIATAAQSGTGSWTQKTDFGGTARVDAVGFSIGCKGYIGTGFDHVVGYLKDFWEYDPVANTWTQKADFGGTARADAVGFSIGSKGYIGTGVAASNSYCKDFWEYDPAANTWTQKADFGGTARFYAVGFSIGSKGYIGTGGSGIPLYKDFWEYEPIANTWTQKADYGGMATAEVVGFSIGSKGYIGMGTNGLRKKDFWEYDPIANTWTQKADFGGTARNATVGFSIGSKGYIGTGIYDDGSPSITKDFWEYEPVANTWTQKADFGGTARFFSVGFSIGSKGYIGTGNDDTGYDGENLTKDFWEYDPGL
jgi:hypothetical protein